MIQPQYPDSYQAAPGRDAEMLQTRQQSFRFWTEMNSVHKTSL